MYVDRDVSSSGRGRLNREFHRWRKRRPADTCHPRACSGVNLLTIQFELSNKLHDELKNSETSQPSDIARVGD